MLQVRRIEAYARSGCSGHLVLFWPAAVYVARLAGGDAGPRSVLSDVAASYGLRHSFLLGRADDQAVLLVYGACSKSQHRPCGDGGPRPSGRAKLGIDSDR